VCLSYLGNGTKVRIVKNLLSGTKTFQELQKSTGCATFFLWLYLNDLKKKKIVTTTVYFAIPMRVEYTLTEFGRTFNPVIIAMAEWGYLINNYKSRFNLE
jgi:DNA-binding HxlR family transcriptional regulator